ncbi:MAG: GNAT family N-acetyltransferase [Treponema sp.]|nr:GNAT family N-acetyltransferase [Treponema sp.]
MIKEINKSDVAECVKVIRSSFMTIAEQFGFTVENAPRFTAFATTEERLLHQLDNEPRFMFAYFDSDGKIVGYYSLLIQDSGECELNNLCVLPEYRHRKIGQELLRDAYRQAEAHNCSKINIGIVEENTILRKWYEKEGFVHIGTEKFDFFPFTCGYMVKELNKQ